MVLYSSYTVFNVIEDSAMEFTIQTLDHLKPLIRGFRKKAHLTQAAMAEKLGISQQSYAQIEANLASTSVDRLFTILRLMDVKIQLTDSDPGTVPDPRIRPRTKGRARVQGTVIDDPGGTTIGPAPAKQIKRNDTTKW